MRSTQFELSMKGIVDDIASYAVSKGIIDTATLDGTVINPGINDQYTDLVVDSSVTLSLVNYQNMGRTQEYRIDTIEFDEFVLGQRPAPGTPYDLNNGSSATFKTPTLNSKAMVSKSAIHDEAIETSIAKDKLVDVFLQKLTVKTSKNFAQLGYFGDVNIVSDGSKQKDLYAEMDGWIKKAGKSLYNDEFDVANIADLLDKLEAAFEDKYIDRTKMAYILPRKEFTAFQQLIASLHPNTQLGTDATTGRKAFYYNDIRVVEELVLSDYLSVADGGTGKVAVLARIDSMVFGMSEELMKIDSWRENILASWVTINTVFPAYTLIAPDAVVVAYFDKAAPVVVPD
jgi:hypothetical protein